MHIMRDISAFLERIEEEKAWGESYPLLQTGKLPLDGFSFKSYPPFSEKATILGFEIKLLCMISALDTTNENIVEVCDIWNLLKLQTKEAIFFSNYYINRQSQLTAYIVYDLRRFVDQAISMTWMLTQDLPISKVKIDSIGKYLDDPTFTVYDEFEEFLRLLNNISNTFKHSVVNDMTMVVGRDEPCVYAFDASNNKHLDSPQMQGITLRELVDKFNAFYKKAISEIMS